MPPAPARSVADPDQEAYDAMIKVQRAYNEARHPELRRGPVTAAKVKRTLDQAGDVMTAYEAAPAAIATLSRDARDLKAAKAVGRAMGPAGKVVSGGAAVAGFMADRAGGMPLDEALIKHAGGQVLGLLGGTGGAMLGAAGGVYFGGPAGAVAGGVGGYYAGSKAGEALGDHAAESWALSKVKARQIKRRFDIGTSNLEDPPRRFGQGRRDW
jgi:hypothetical protein